jgi:hypothetical protein
MARSALAASSFGRLSDKTLMIYCPCCCANGLPVAVSPA